MLTRGHCAACAVAAGLTRPCGAGGRVQAGGHHRERLYIQVLPVSARDARRRPARRLRARLHQSCPACGAAGGAPRPLAPRSSERGRSGCCSPVCRAWGGRVYDSCYQEPHHDPNTCVRGPGAPPMACHRLAARRHERADTYVRPWTRPAVAGPGSRLKRLRLWVGDRQLRKRCGVSAPCRVPKSSVIYCRTCTVAILAAAESLA